MIRALASASAIAIAAAPASAQGFYVDGGYTFFGIDVEDSGSSIDVDLGAITGHAGYNINDLFAVEAEVGFGVADEEFSGGGVSTDISLSYLIGAFGKVQYPVQDNINLFARAGVVNAELELEASGGGATFSDSASDTGFGIGVGADAYFGERSGLRVDYTRYDIEDLEADAFSIGYKYRF